MTKGDQALRQSNKAKRKKRKKSRLEALLDAKREQTRKAIEKLRERRMKKLREAGSAALPAAQIGPAKGKKKRERDRRSKDRVAHLARMIVQDRAPELRDINKARSLRDWLMQVPTREWSSVDRRQLEFLLDVLNAVVARKRPANIEKPDGGYFRWPSTEADESDQGGTMKKPDQDLGVLRSVGYRVGANGLDWAERRILLTQVYEQELDVDLSPAYLDEWGEPRTAQRLQKLANTIASLTRNMKRRRHRQIRSPAIDQWEDDLAFLKRTYYVGRYDFAWPTS